MSERPEVLIVGGGVIGLTTAYFLARERVSVEVVDKGNFGQEASWAGAGILPPGNPDRARSPYDQLRAQSAVLYPTLSAELRDRTGMDNGYVRCGGLEFIGTDDAGAVRAWHEEGIAFEVVDRKALARLEPTVVPGSGKVYHLPDMAQLRNPWHVKALLAACGSLGVQLRSGCPVHGFEVQGERIRALRTGLGRLEADRFLLATGAWTDTLLEQVGWRPGIHPVRGQIALLETTGPLFRRIVLHEARYLVPRPDGRVLVGSTEEHAGFDKRTTAGAIGELLAFAFALVPDLAGAHLERCWAGLRPGSPDGLPFLGPVPGFVNLFVAAGHFRAGIQLSPATGLVLKELLLDQPRTVALEPFRLDRNPAPPARLAFRS
jgi:glycine oxidase